MHVGPANGSRVWALEASIPPTLVPGTCVLVVALIGCPPPPPRHPAPPMFHSATISFQEFLVMFDRVFTPNRLFGATLRAAAGRGQADVVLDLVSRGCNPNAGDGKGWRCVLTRADPCGPDVWWVRSLPVLFDVVAPLSAVHHAAEYGHVEPIRVMQKLYGADLDIDAEDTAGWLVHHSPSLLLHGRI